MIGLKPCPFCGKSAVLMYDQRTQEHYVICTKCRTKTSKEKCGKRVSRYDHIVDCNRGGGDRVGRNEDRIKRKYDAMLQKEMEDAVKIVYSAAGIALWQNNGWRKGRIIPLLEETGTIWNECARQADVAMLRMLEDETGIELRARGCDKSWHELDFLNGDNPARQMNIQEFIYMRQRQIPWVEPQITAAMLLALHRLHGWSGARDERLLRQAEAIEAAHRWRPAKMVEACREITGVNIYEEVNR